MSQFRLSILSCIFVCIVPLSAHRILVLHPVFAGSHVRALRTISEQLLKEGHEVTVVRWSESSNISPLRRANFSDLILSVNNSKGNIPFFSKEEKARVEFPHRHMWDRGLFGTSIFDGGMKAATAYCDSLLSRSQLRRKLRELDFSIAIVDLLYNECGLALAYNLSLPVVAYWPISVMSGELQYTTAFNPPSFSPHMYTFLTNRMNFYQRLINVYYGLCGHFVMQLQFYYSDYYIQKYLPGTPHPQELLTNLSGLLLNSHVMFDYPIQLPPTFLQVGGFHIKDLNPLPLELREFMEDAPHGIILLSLGRNFEPSSIPNEVFYAYMNAFGRLQQKVIMKITTEVNNLPKNVKTMISLPQNEILAHPKTILFITHGGMHSVMEAIHHGVKMVVVPIFFDQGDVAARLQDHEVALTLSKTSSEEEIFETINAVITDRRFETNIKRLSKLYHSTLENPLERSVWLINHVIETNGANHLKLKVNDLNFVQYFCIDVLVVMLFIAAACLYLVGKCLLWVRKMGLGLTDRVKRKLD